MTPNPDFADWRANWPPRAAYTKRPPGMYRKANGVQIRKRVGELTKHQWLLSGVGRSGTTFGYTALLQAARTLNENASGRYEPFIWGRPIWDKHPTEFKNEIGLTSSMNISGIQAHLKTPLFAAKANSALGGFVDEIFPEEQPVIAKMIRAAGRFDAFLDARPNLKIIHLIRNPMDVVNSALNYFSFFGSEFHASDEPRFNKEGADWFPHLHRPTFDLSEAEKHAQWWRLMNEAALQSAKKSPKQIKIVAYEFLKMDPKAAMREIVEFLGVEEFALADVDYSSVVGPATKSCSLRVPDRDSIAPYVDQYFADRRVFFGPRNKIDKNAIRSGISDRYGDCEEGLPFSPAIAPDITPVAVRAATKRMMNEQAAHMTAGAKQVEDIIAQITERQATERIESEKAISDAISTTTDRLIARIGKAEGVLAAKNKEAERLAQLLEDSEEARTATEHEIKLVRKSVEEKSGELETANITIARLRTRLASIADDIHKSKSAESRAETRSNTLEAKLKETETRLREVAGEKERYRKSLMALEGVLRPQLRTIFTLRPLRHVWRRRQQMKSGLIEIAPDGIARPK